MQQEGREGRRAPVKVEGFDAPDLLAVSRALLDDSQLKLLEEVAQRIRPRIREMALGWRSEVTAQLLPSLAPTWGPEEAVRDATALLESLASGDMGQALEVARAWAKGLAEGGIPFLTLVQVLRLWERQVLEFLFNAYPRIGGLKRAIEAFGDLAQAYALVSAQAYVEVHQLTIAHLQADLREALSRPDLLWWAFLESADLLGLRSVHPRVLAQRILERAEYPGTLEVRGGKFIHTGPHVLVRDCPGEPDSCLSAFLAEAKVEAMSGQALNIEAVRLLPDDQCEVVLVPLLGSPPRA